MNTIFSIISKKLELLPSFIGDNQAELFNLKESKRNLFFIGELDKVRNPYIKIGLETAQRFDVDAVYFRRFEGENRPPLAQIYIYDFSEKNLNKEIIKEKHKQLWNAGVVPVFYVFSKTDVIIFNCLKGPEFDEKTETLKYSVFEVINDIAKSEVELSNKGKQLIDIFSARNFDNGTFLENPAFANDFSLKNSAYEKLLGALKIIRQHLINKIGDIAHKLLVMSIFVKYLDERRDLNGDSVFKSNYFDKFAKKENAGFIDVFKVKGAILELFDDLSNPDKFNGEIFKWSDTGEREKLGNADLSQVSEFLDGRVDLGGQLVFFWQLYSFNHIPIELISNIYEEFLGKKAGVVYTPPFLVNLLVDECMPLEKPLQNLKILDPSCGSSIFLVTTYKRLVFWWRIMNNWKQAPIKVLKSLLTENIFGVDKDQEAIRVSIFSLNLAMCDLLSPKQIREELKFESLRNTNFFAEDFFELIQNKKLPLGFDLIIGNPPFGNFKSNKDLLSKPAIDIDREMVNLKLRKSIPKYEISLLFAEQALKLCKPSGILCLIIPSGNLLYNNNSFEFRKYLFSNFQIMQIFDFTHIARVLFKATSSQREGGSDVSTLALFAKKEKPNEKDILHLTFRRTKPIKEKLYFEIDKYDFHWVSKRIALSNKKEDKLVWKANYLGGGRIHYLVKKLSEIDRTFGEFIESKVKNDNWVVGEGFKIGNSARNIEIYLKETNRIEYLENNFRSLNEKDKQEYRKLCEKYSKATFLTNKRTLKFDGLTENGIDFSKVDILRIKYFYKDWIRKPKIFEPPHILIREFIGKTKLAIALSNEFISFPSQIIGYHAPKETNETLENIILTLNKKVILFSLLLSGRAFISKATSILKADIDNLPFPKDEKELELTEIEQIIVDDVLDYMRDFRSAGENSKVIQPPTNEELENFGKLYCEMMNTVYKNLNPYRPIETKSFICYPFYFGDKTPELEINDLKQFEEDLEAIIVKNIPQANLRTIRVLQVYDKNVIYMIKPKQLRYWLQSIAIRDADDSGSYLQKLGF